MVEILVIDDEADILEVMRAALSRQGRKVEVTTRAETALELAQGDRHFDVVITDLNLKSKITGLDLLRQFKENHPDTQVILMSGYSTLDSAVEGVRAGALDYISKPFDVREVTATVDRALTSRAPAAPPAAAAPLPAGLVGRTREMLEVYKQIALAADSSTPVLVIGESGTGKELVARAIHDYGKGGARPFVAINCGALAETLLESELFGHVRGSFTGAVGDKKGLFEQANGGTIFLDEIGETSPGLQVKLLRVLQEGEVRPVGGTRPVKVNARVLAATNRELKAEVAEKRFRQDLFYRLSAFVIHLPALRERREDIPMLAGQFLRAAVGRARKDVQLTPDAIEQLAAHAWPGNVRELENIVERLVISCRTDRISRVDVQDVIGRDTEAPASFANIFSQLPSLDELERQYLIHVLDVTKGHRTRTAKILKIDRKRLYRMAARFGISLGREQSGMGE
ncbi:MAG: sigma-54-dependent Fis family transcriptional regulator [Acidobacteria bacterium]|nr:sigma-54-dependent Fis family transcriptional regulator [Acidobacteriota bacterium]